MAKFKELQVGQKVRLVSSKHTDSEHGYIPQPMLEVGEVGTITDLRTADKGVRLNSKDFVYHRKDLEIITEDVSEPVRTEPVTTAKDVPVGTKVRVRDFNDPKFNKSPDRLYHLHMESSIGKVYTVQHVHSRGVLLSNGWNYCFDVVEPVAEQPVLTTESSTSKVDASTPVGTKVRVLRDQADGYYKAGAVGTLRRHDGDDKPRVDFLDGFWYPHYDNLEIVPQDTPDTVCEPELEPEPVPEPKELTLEDFVVTRVRVRSTGYKGTVIGHTRSGSVGVQHDVDVPGTRHRCAPQLGKAEGAVGRCWWYSPSELEIINEEV